MVVPVIVTVDRVFYFYLLVFLLIRLLLPVHKNFTKTHIIRSGSTLLRYK